jgi:pantoate kinase
LDFGVLTRVKVKPSEKTLLEISINGERARAETTRSVVDRLLNLSKKSFDIRIEHFCRVPIGAGFGTSGAGALGTAMALSKALGLSLTRGELLTIAHVAEVTCGTGLGDVGAQNLGGLVIGLRPGAPPWGKWKRIPVSRDLRVICCTLGRVPTSRLLRKNDFCERARVLGMSAMRKLLSNPTLGNFMDVSGEFSEKLGLVDEDLRPLIESAKRAGALGASQVMLGRAVFAFAKRRDVVKIRRVLLELVKPGEFLVARINSGGAKLYSGFEG